jgi:hypothetical protein
MVLLLTLAGGCAFDSHVKPVEYLDDRTAMTVGALEQPIEMLPSVRAGGAHLFGKRPSFAYLGPIEWDRSGTLTYALWIHIAPGSTQSLADLRSPGALTLVLDGGAQVLEAIDAPQLGKGPYEPVASWGQTAYFALTPDMLRQIAASEKLELDALTTNGSMVNFVPTHDARAVLTDYLQARGIAGD